VQRLFKDYQKENFTNYFTQRELKPVVASIKVELPSEPHYLSLSRDEKKIAVAYGDQVAIYEMSFDSSNAIISTQRHLCYIAQVKEIAWAPGDDLALVTTKKNAIILCDAKKEQSVRISHTNEVTAFAWSPDGIEFAVGFDTGHMRIYGRINKEEKRSFPVPTELSGKWVPQHINWGNENVLLVCYMKYDKMSKVPDAHVCIYEGSKYFLSKNVNVFGTSTTFEPYKSHPSQFYSCFLDKQLMFVLGSSFGPVIHLFSYRKQSWNLLKSYQTLFYSKAALVSLDIRLRGECPIILYGMNSGVYTSVKLLRSKLGKTSFSFGSHQAVETKPTGFSVGTVPQGDYSFAKPTSDKVPGGGFAFGGFGQATTTVPSTQPFGFNRAAEPAAGKLPGGGFAFGGFGQATTTVPLKPPFGFSGAAEPAAGKAPSGRSSVGETGQVMTSAPAKSGFSKAVEHAESKAPGGGSSVGETGQVITSAPAKSGFSKAVEHVESKSSSQGFRDNTQRHEECVNCLQEHGISLRDDEFIYVSIS
jgi:hypothetical protein